MNVFVDRNVLPSADESDDSADVLTTDHLPESRPVLNRCILDLLIAVCIFSVFSLKAVEQVWLNGEVMSGLVFGKPRFSFQCQTYWTFVS